MIKIRALNRESLSDEDAPAIRREAQEEIALDMYNKALRNQCNGNLEEAKDILQKLLTENIPQLESQGGLPKTMSTLKYSCYYNMGNIDVQNKNDLSALENYLSAAELDSSDVTLWHKIGTIALKLDRFRQAAYAFLKGLEYNESHWPCLDKLISVLYALQDTVLCLCYIGKALILDKDYIKGLVLRKLIFTSNPATKEYYQAYNPDYILEPDFDISVSEEDEKKVIEDVEPLCSRLNEIEKALGPKPLPTISLPTPLEDFTWISLGKTIINLHKYLTENKMSYFSKVDLTKCMSGGSDVENPSGETLLDNVNENVSECKSNNPTNMDIQNMDVENVPVEENFERRPSLSSENNNLSEPNCSQGEDNDEMDQDTEDQEDNAEQKFDKKRGTKRRRDLLSDLQIWGWHSKRKSAKKGKSEKDLTIQDALQRVIPSYLLPNGINLEKRNSDKNKSIDDIFSNLKNQVTVPSGTSEKYFGTDMEKSDVMKFWTKERDCCDAVNLIEEYTVALASLWNKKWPKDLIFMYIEAYERYRQHFEHPQLFNGLSTFEELRNDALVTVMFGEIIYFYMKKEDRGEKEVHPTSLIQLQMLSTWKEQWQDEYIPMFVRIHWLRAKILKGLSNHNLAICAYQLIEEAINEEESKTGCQFLLTLPNCINFNVITKEITQKLLNHLEIIESLSHVQQLFEKQSYAEVINILKQTFDCGPNPPTWGRLGRPAQLGFLLHSFWFTDRTECFIWTEKCIAEATEHFIGPTADEDKWEMLLCKCIGILHEIIKEETVSVVDTLPHEHRIRLIENLCKIVCQQLSIEGKNTIPLGCVTPWLVLHYVLLREEHRRQAKNITKHVKKDKRVTKNKCQLPPMNEDEVPPSIAVLFSAHEFLGAKSWCLTGQGELLHFIVDRILDRLDTPIFEPLREKIDIHLEQAFFCLYQHPSKKNKVSRHLADHNVNPIPLTWERAQQLYEFFCPEALPEFDSYKSISISSDLEQLLQRITALVPNQYDPNPLLPKIKDYVEGNSETLPECINFPIKTRAIYYLLGDYYFKQNDIPRSLKYFHLDLCCNPWRLDTWADMALGLASQLESKLNHCERFKSENEFHEKAKSAQICFKQALKLADNHITLWIEYGAFEYMVHSFYSRILKYESDTISMERFEKLENLKESFLDSSGKSFKRALDLYRPDQAEPDERWLHHYMLGKVAEKRRMEPTEYLQHYLKASELLQENKAVYPEKINYTNPQHLAVEALEIHYRVHASILKYLELHEGKNIPVIVGKMFKKCLESCVYPESTYSQPEIEKEPSESADKLAVKMNVKEPVEECNKVEISQTKNEGVEADTKKSGNVTGENPKKDSNLDVDIKDVIMISDSDDERSPQKGKQSNSEDEIMSPQLRIKNVQELMDEVMQKTMKEEELIQEIDSDTANAEAEFNKFFENTKSKLQTEISKCIKEGQDSHEEKDAIDKKPKLENGDSKIKKEEEEKNIRKSLDDTTTTCTSSSDSSSSDSDSDDSSSTTTTTTSSDAPTGYLSTSEVENLIDRCIAGLEQCIIKLPQNYKALYRLTHLFFHYKSRKDLSKCRQLLLGQYKCRNNVLVSGLFSDRKTSNFFNGVWRIPSSEIDRPGSLAAHMGRCVTILLQVVRNTNDHKILLDVCLQLRRTPDSDKIYIRHSDRLQLSDQALSLCIQALKTQIKNMENIHHSSAQKFLLDMYRAYQRIQKHIPSKEREFSSMLEEVYRKFMKDKLPDNVNALDLAVKFCQQHKAAEKIKIQQQKPTPSISAPTVSTSIPPSRMLHNTTTSFLNHQQFTNPINAPVLPAPSNVSSSLSQPLKRPPVVGRTRGRPPGPSKNPTVSRASRGRGINRGYGPFSTYQGSSMYDSKSLNFMMQYQEELLRQYSQLSQMNQLASSGSLLSPSQLVQFFTQLSSGRMNPLNMSHLTQSLSHMNPTLLSKLAEMVGMPQLTANLWGNLGTMGTPTSMHSSTNTFGNQAQQSKPTTIPLPKTPISTSGTFQKPNTSSSSQPEKPSTSVKKTSFVSPLVSSTPTSSSTFKYPSMEVPKIKSKDVTKTTPSTYTSSMEVPKIKSKDVTKTTPSTYTSKDVHVSKFPITSQPSTSLMSDVAKLLTKDRPSISITPVTQTATSTVTTSMQPKPRLSPAKTLQEKLADKQKHASASGKSTAKSFHFEPAQSSSSTRPEKTAPLNPPKQIPNFPKDSGMLVSQVPRPAVTKHQELHKKEESPTKPKSKEFPMSLSISPVPLATQATPKASEINQRKDSSDDDVIIIE